MTHHLDDIVIVEVCEKRYTHTCHTSHCEIQNFALLKSDSHKIFKSHMIFRPSKTHFTKKKIIFHALLCLSGQRHVIVKRAVIGSKGGWLAQKVGGSSALYF